MMKPASAVAWGVLTLCALVPSALPAQNLPPLEFPQASPKALVSQTIGLTDITISYHRPAVNQRRVWDSLVPYNQVWRGGANQNTTIEFSTSVTINGTPLPAGIYGLHIIPTAKDWTIIFSQESKAWGSFSYDQKEDAARVTATPQQAAFQERLGYTLDEPTANGVTATLRWERLAVPFKIAVDVPTTVVANLREQLRGLPRFGWQAWNQAAAYSMANNMNLDQALKWADNSIAINENFNNLRVKAALLDKRGDSAGATALRTKSLTLANEGDLNLLGYQLLGAGKTDEAIEVFRKNVKDYPASWNTYDSLAEAYLAKGDKKLALANYQKAFDMAKDETQKKRIQGVLANLK